MTAFISSVLGVTEILVLIALGYFLAAKNWLSKDSGKIIAKIVTQVALPAYMVVTVSSKFSAKELINLLPQLRYPLISMAILGVLSAIVMRLIHVEKMHEGLFCSMFLNSNTVFIGLPVNLALFGAKSLPYVLVYYMANTTIFGPSACTSSSTMAPPPRRSTGARHWARFSPRPCWASLSASSSSCCTSSYPTS